jgi:hypothetical protein
MFAKSLATPLLALSSLVLQADAVSKKHWSKRAENLYLPKEVNDYQTATAPNNVTIRYKNPGICETTPGVNSYSGYVDLSPNVRISSLFTQFAIDLTSHRFMFSSGSSNLEATHRKIPSRFGSMADLDRTR